MWQPADVSGHSSGYEELPAAATGGRSPSPRREASPRHVHWSSPPARSASRTRRDPTPQRQPSPRQERKGKGKGKSKGKGKRGRGRGGRR